MKFFFKIENGKLIQASGQVVPNGYRIDWENLEKKEDGSYADYYHEDLTIDWNKENQDHRTKEEKLRLIIVTVSTGKKFYANAESRADISDAIAIAQEQGATDSDATMWKTADGLMPVTVAELREARKLGLEAKAQIIGVENV